MSENITIVSSEVPRKPRATLHYYTSDMTPWLWPLTAVRTMPGRSMSVRSGQSGDEISMAMKSLLNPFAWPLQTCKARTNKEYIDFSVFWLTKTAKRHQYQHARSKLNFTDLKKWLGDSSRAQRQCQRDCYSLVWHCRVQF